MRTSVQNSYNKCAPHTLLALKLCELNKPSLSFKVIPVFYGCVGVLFFFFFQKGTHHFKIQFLLWACSKQVLYIFFFMWFGVVMQLSFVSDALHIPINAILLHVIPRFCFFLFLNFFPKRNILQLERTKEIQYYKFPPSLGKHTFSPSVQSAPHKMFYFVAGLKCVGLLCLPA